MYTFFPISAFIFVTWCRMTYIMQRANAYTATTIEVATCQTEEGVFAVREIQCESQCTKLLLVSGNSLTELERYQSCRTQLEKSSLAALEHVADTVCGLASTESQLGSHHSGYKAP